MENVKKQLKIFLISFIIVFILFLIANLMMFNIAKSICQESEVKPVRYEFSGLFGTKHLIITTPENSDSYERVCIKSGTPKFFTISENINYVLENINTTRGGSE